MAPFSAWLPVQPSRGFDLILRMVGKDNGGLLTGLRALEHGLAVGGFQVLSQSGTCPERSSYESASLRISTEPVGSIGNGCDVLACLDDPIELARPSALARGSVLLGETEAIQSLMASASQIGVIAYALPLSVLTSRCGLGPTAKGLVVVGAIARLFGLALDTVRAHLGGSREVDSFDAGADYVDDHLMKRDVFALPCPAGGSPNVMLDAQTAVLLGLGIADCRCASACFEGPGSSLEKWVSTHVTQARNAMSCFRNPRFEGMIGYCGDAGRLMAVLGAEAFDIVWSDEPEFPCRARIVTAGDILDAVRLTGLARRVVLESRNPVCIVLDTMLAHRRQTVSLQTLENVVKEIEWLVAAKDLSSQAFTSERDGDLRADVGYLAWGSTQGIVREAVSLCRSFGMNVSAIYPRALLPVPREEIESFAASVRHLVVVESAERKRYTALVRWCTDLTPSTIAPQHGCTLTPMDIFMREGLGA